MPLLPIVLVYAIAANSGCRGIIAIFLVQLDGRKLFKVAGSTTCLCLVKLTTDHYNTIFHFFK